ncbi:MAG: sulfotransferase domain-containing protein [Candidatus Competibacterales bacterium]
MTGSSSQALRIYQNHHLDSIQWTIVNPRDDDIVITTSYKSGTTWMQFILHRLLFAEDPAPPSLLEASPWIERRREGAAVTTLAARIEGQTHRRFFKSHLPADGLPFLPSTRYLVIARDPRDVFMSLDHHWSAYTEERYRQLNSHQVGAPFPRWGGTLQGRWRQWITRGWFEWESEGYPFWSNLHHTATWWPLQSRANVLLLHYNDLLADLAGQIRRIATFLALDVEPQQVEAVAAAAHIDNMRKTLASGDDNIGHSFQGGVTTFINKGTNQRWRGVLDADDLALYEGTRGRLLDPACAAWLEGGWLAG